MPSRSSRLCPFTLASSSPLLLDLFLLFFSLCVICLRFFFFCLAVQKIARTWNRSESLGIGFFDSVASSVYTRMASKKALFSVSHHILVLRWCPPPWYMVQLPFGWVAALNGHVAHIQAGSQCARFLTLRYESLHTSNREICTS